jgi:CubicO group peptidase (beta-lactamase class C family)
VDTNTIYRVGSITKLITNLMLFQLRDQGKLSLDDPVSVRPQMGGEACLPLTRV